MFFLIGDVVLDVVDVAVDFLDIAGVGAASFLTTLSNKSLV